MGTTSSGSIGVVPVAASAGISLYSTHTGTI